MITGNKGEWGEIYVFLHLLAEGRLYAGDKELKKIGHIFYPVISIIRNEGNSKIEYRRNISETENGASSITVLDNNEGQINEVLLEEFRKNSEKLLNSIKTSSGRAFACEDVEVFLKKIGVRSIKSSSAKKEDIDIVVNDFYTQSTKMFSFSIKSNMGRAPTLLNASQSTNFIYELFPHKVGAAHSKIIDGNIGTKNKVEQILNNGFKLEFESVSNPIFESNLQMIDLKFPKIVSELLLKYYSKQASDIETLTKILGENDPLDFGKNKRFYSHKIKNFLREVALGMKPNTKWEGDYDAAGGYIIITEEGNIICYHTNNANEFKDYLFENTKLETSSTKRNKFGDVYKEDARFKIKLNLQIRFID